MLFLGTLSSVNLIAGASILGNIGGVAITANSTLTNNISSYTSLAVVNQFANVALTGFVSINIVANTFPALTNAIPTAYQSALGNGTMTSLITTQSNNILGSGDLGKFDQVFSAAVGYVGITNQLIKSAINAGDSNVTTGFTTQDNVITGGFSGLTQAFAVFGSDLARLGSLINFENLNNLGTPLALLRQINSLTFSTPALNTALLDAGVPQDLVDDPINNEFTDAQQKAVYQAMTTITGTALTEILKLLKVTTSNIQVLSDLLNPVKIFPNSFNTFTTFTANGLRGIYINESGTVNSLLEIQLPESELVSLQGQPSTTNTPYSRLRKIIPEDQALANKALASALLQVKAIFNTTGVALAVAMQGLESNKNLNLINSITQPIPDAVRNYFLDNYADGSGPNGILLLTDVIGTPSGWIINNSLGNAITVLTQMTTAGTFANLTNSSNGVYTVMAATAAGVYTTSVETDPGPPPVYEYTVTIPNGLPGSGTYGPYASSDEAVSAAFVNLDANMIANVNSIVSTNSTLVGYTNDDWNAISSQIQRENTNLALAEIVFANLVPNTRPTGLVSNLSDYGLDTAEGGAAFYLEAVANVNNQGGQAVVSTMRESRNLERLSLAGIETDIIVSDVVAEPRATLSNGQYTASEAASQKII